MTREQFKTFMDRFVNVAAEYDIGLASYTCPAAPVDEPAKATFRLTTDGEDPWPDYYSIEYVSEFNGAFMVALQTSNEAGEMTEPMQYVSSPQAAFGFFYT